MNTVQTPENIIKIILFPGELAVRDQRPPDGDILLLLPGDAVPHALLVVQLHDGPLTHHHLLLTSYVGPFGRARLVDAAADVVQQDAEEIHQGHYGTDEKN